MGIPSVIKLKSAVKGPRHKANVTQTFSYDEFLARLDALGLFHMDLSLDRMAAFVERCGLPRFPVLHVVGTNGKGSTATLLAELLQAHGLKVGLSVSPHFVDVRERILVNGAMLDQETWARLGSRVLAEDLGLTYFEVLTAVSLLAFAEAGCDVAVMEAGLGGRFDATNVLKPSLTVFTPIGLDHMAVLGNSLEEIAGDKAGALRQGGLAVSAPQEPAAWRVLRGAARDLGAELVPAAEVLFYSRANGRVQPGPLGRGGKRLVRPMTGLWLSLPGTHQELNARTALAAFHIWASALRLPVSEAACREAFRRAFIPGRMQLVDAAPGLPSSLPPRLILDGGHNAHGLKALKAALEADGLQPEAVVFGCLRDKPLDEMLPLLRDIAGAGRLLAVGIPSCERACTPEELAEKLGAGAQTAPDVHAALEALKGVPGPVLVCGSLYLLGEFYTKQPRLLERDPSAGSPRRF